MAAGSTNSPFDTTLCAASWEASNRQQAASMIGQWLSNRLGRHVAVVLTNNRTVMMTVKKVECGISLRIHQRIVEAEPHIWDALERYLHNWDKRAGKVLDAYFAKTRTPRADVNLKTLGRVHDLGQIFSTLNHTYFSRMCSARIGWGKGAGRRPKRSMQLGCYYLDERVIRIHPCLDQTFVPTFYVAGVVFHEMLHDVFGVDERDGRMVAHPPAFRALEESYPDYERCMAWETQNVRRLMRWRPTKNSRY